MLLLKFLQFLQWKEKIDNYYLCILIELYDCV